MDKITLSVLLSRECNDIEDAKAKKVLIENAVASFPSVVITASINIREVPDDA